MKKAKSKKKIVVPKKSDFLVTQAMLFEVREELKADIKSSEKKLRAEIHVVRAEIHGLKAEIQEVKSQVQRLESAVHAMAAEIHRIALLVEEQNARNAIVLDGLTSLFHRQDRIEERFEELKKIVTK